MTYHREVGWAFVVVMVVLLGIFGLPALLMLVATAGDRAAAVAVAVYFAIALLPFVVALVLRLALRLDVVTVYGRRTKAQMHFWFRKARARQAYQQISRLAGERQQRARRPLGVRPPAPPSAPSLPPTLG